MTTDNTIIIVLLMTLTLTIVGTTLCSLLVDVWKERKRKHQSRGMVDKGDDESDIIDDIETNLNTYRIRLGIGGFYENKDEDNLLNIIRCIRDICEDERVDGNISIPTDEHSQIMDIRIEAISPQFDHVYERITSECDAYITYISYDICR